MKSLFFLLLSAFLFTSCVQNKEAEPDLNTPEYPFLDPELQMDERINDLVDRLSLEEKAAQMGNSAPAIERLGIPEYDWWNEALHGIARNGRATVFPQAIALGATFDRELIYEISSAIGDEARAKYNISTSMGNRGRFAGLTFWSPNVNIFRDPRWGRGQETYGEDPYLTSVLGSEFVKGLQGNNPDVMKAAACAKHFLVHSGPEGLRHEFNAMASPRDMQETYLPAFRALTEAGVEGFMCAYNRTNSEPCCGSSYFLTQLLRDEWGFDGYITSDCGALRNFYNGHNYTDGPVEAAALALKSGVNLNCGSLYANYLVDAVETGLITEEEIDASLRQLMKTRFRLGLFDPPENSPFRDLGEEVINSKKHKELALQAAENSMVLLKNDNILPIEKDIRSLYMIGPHTNDLEVLLGNYYGLSGELVSFLEGITSKISAGTTVNYKHGFLLDRENINPIDWSISKIKSHDITFVFGGISPLIEGEEGESIASEYAGDRYDYGLPDSQVDYIKKIGENKGDKPVVLVLTGGSPIDISEVESYVDAIIFAWYPGQEGGNALANLIFGDKNFSGRLPVTFPRSLDQLPDYRDYDMSGRTYKYMNEDPYYPFGYGLSYTKFRYGSLVLSTNEITEETTEIKATVELKNTGALEGEEVIQLYCSFPEAAAGAPNYRLIAFRRVEIPAGESVSAEFKIRPEDLQSYDEAGNPLLVPGRYTIFAGGASPLKRSRELGVSFVEAGINVR